MEMDKRHNLKTEYKNIVKEYIDKLNSQGIHVKQAYIFGSQIKGTAHKWSDLDICIISDSFGKDRPNERIKLMKIGDSIDDIIEPHPFSPEDFADKYNPFVQEIKRTGYQII